MDEHQNQMDKDWESFSETMMEHIGEQRKKYQITDNIEIAQLLPAGWALGDAMKYTYEIVHILDDPQLMSTGVSRSMVMENLLKAAHCLQICYSKLNRG